MTTTKNNRGRSVTIWIGLIVLIAAAFVFRFGQLGETVALASIRSVQESEGMPVETVRAATEDLEKWITVAGTVEGETQYPIVSQNSLSVVAIPVQEGDRVEAGDVIIRLESGAPSPMYHSLDSAKANYEQALTDVKRLRNLFAEGAVSESELDGAETLLKVREAGLQDAEGTTALRASEAGVVSSILIDEGETVSVGKPLVWILGADNVKVRFTAGSAQARELEVGQLVRVEGDRTADGRGEISRLDLMADAQTHLLEGEATLPNAGGRHVPGILLSLRVRTHDRPQALTVPQECLVDTDEGSGVWTVVRNGAEARANLVPVTTGVEDGNSVEILSGLEANAEVVKFGQTLLSENILVNVIEREAGK